MLKHDIGFFKASDSIHLNPYESQLSSASDKYNPSYPRLLMLNLGKYSADAPLHNRANDINLTTLNIEFWRLIFFQQETPISQPKKDLNIERMKDGNI